MSMTAEAILETTLVPSGIVVDGPLNDHSILDGLNEQQKQAVLCTEGPLLCLAGAGSGKTRVLTRRIAHLINNHGILPGHILALTFTRKAAEEMRHRIAEMVGSDIAGEITLGTFHSLGAQILREYGNLVGVSPKFGIADEDEVQKRVRDAMDQNEIPRGDLDWRPREVCEMITEAKTLYVEDLCEQALAGKLPENIDGKLVHAYRSGPVEMFARLMEEYDLDVPDLQMFARIYAAYEGGLARDNVVDFQDLLSLPAILYLEREDILRVYQNRFLYLLIDEYQDTDALQDHFLRLLAGERRNLMVVGDDDQSIYGWRRAEVENIRSFPQRYAPCSVVMLEENYRSTPSILRIANAVLAHQEGRYAKALRPNLPDGARVRVWSCASQEVEAHAILRECFRMLRQGEIESLDDVMVLYRKNSLAEPLEAALRRAQIAYKMVSGTRFTDRKEVRDLIGFMRLANNWSDTVSFERVVNVPSRGISPAVMESVLQLARTSLYSPVEICQNADQFEEFTKRQRNALMSFGQIVQEITTVAAERGPAAAAHEAIALTGYRDHLIERLNKAEAEDDIDDIEDVERRLDTIDDFLQYIEEFCRTTSSVVPSLTEFLHAVAVLTIGEFVENRTPEEIAAAALQNGSISLMSVHGSKGLEAPVVFVVGLEEGVFPIVQDEEGEELEEEERLFYVAVTRAQQRLILSSSRTREVRKGDLVPMRRSRFIARLPEDSFLIENKNRIYDLNEVDDPDEQDPFADLF